MELIEDSLVCHHVEDYRVGIGIGSAVDGILQPFQMFAVNRDHVEAAGRRHPVTLQIDLRREDQARLLAAGYAGSGATVPQIGASPHFNKYQHLVFLHDEVDLAALATKIALQQRLSLRQQMSQRGIFAGLAFDLLQSLAPVCAEQFWQRIKQAQRTPGSKKTMPF